MFDCFVFTLRHLLLLVEGFACFSHLATSLPFSLAVSGSVEGDGPPSPRVAAELPPPLRFRKTDKRPPEPKGQPVPSESEAPAHTGPALLYQGIATDFARWWEGMYKKMACFGDASEPMSNSFSSFLWGGGRIWQNLTDYMWGGSLGLHYPSLSTSLYAGQLSY